MTKFLKQVIWNDKQHIPSILSIDVCKKAYILQTLYICVPKLHTQNQTSSTYTIKESVCACASVAAITYQTTTTVA